MPINIGNGTQFCPHDHHGSSHNRLAVISGNNPSADSLLRLLVLRSFFQENIDHLAFHRVGQWRVLQDVIHDLFEGSITEFSFHFVARHVVVGKEEHVGGLLFKSFENRRQLLILKSNC